MANSILKRRSTLAFSSLTPIQLQQSHLSESFVKLAADPANLGAMTLGSLSFKFAKWGFLEGAAVLNLGRHVPKFVLRSSSTLFALSVEVTSFRSGHHYFGSTAGKNSAEKIFDSKAWWATAIDLGALKSFGLLAAGQNPILQNFIPSNAMILARRVSEELDLIPIEHGNYIQKLAHAQVMLSSLGAGMSFTGLLTGGRIQKIEILARVNSDTHVPPRANFFESLSSRKRSLNVLNSENLDELGFPIKNTEVVRDTQQELPLGDYFRQFHDSRHSLFWPFGKNFPLDQVGISEAYGTAHKTDPNGAELVHLAGRGTTTIIDYSSPFALQGTPEHTALTNKRYEAKQDKFATYAMVFWYCFLKGRDAASSAFLSSDVPSNFLHHTRHWLGYSPVKSKTEGLKFSSDIPVQYLQKVFERYGVDPLLFVVRMQNEMIGGYYMTIKGVDGDPIRVPQGRFAGRELVNMLVSIQREWTVDIFQALLQHRAWRETFPAFHSDKVASSGALYTSYYQGEKPANLNELYYNLRNPQLDPQLKAALLKKASRLMQVEVQRLISNPENTILIPVISDAFPTQELGKALANETNLPYLSDAWRPRPVGYKIDVEGRTLAKKMEILKRVLHLTDKARTRIAGNNVILIDDNITDGATFVMAQILLFQAGARSVKLATLTRTIRDANDLNDFKANLDILSGINGSIGTKESQ